MAGDAVARAVAQVVPKRCRARSIPVLGPLLFWSYRIRSRVLRNWIRWFLYRFEGGSSFSVNLRRVFAAYHGLEVGMYSHGAWTELFALDPGTKVGRYCSIAAGARVITANHPMNIKSTSALFFNPELGLVGQAIGPSSTTMTIGNDVWIGRDAIVLPSVRRIGDGAVIGAGAVVFQDVPPFAVVIGHPARAVRYRFSESKIAELLASRWWDKSLEELLPDIASFLQPLEDEIVR
jgi:virginiamycin A acetyltransferase